MLKISGKNNYGIKYRMGKELERGEKE